MSLLLFVKNKYETIIYYIYITMAITFEPIFLGSKSSCHANVLYISLHYIIGYNFTLEAVFTILYKEHNNRVAYTIENAYIRVYSGLPDSICYRSRRRWVWYDRPWYEQKS